MKSYFRGWFIVYFIAFGVYAEYTDYSDAPPVEAEAASVPHYDDVKAPSRRLTFKMLELFSLLKNGMQMPPTVFQSPPMVLEHPPVALEPPPVVVQRPPVVVQRPPVVVQRPPVVVQRPPVVLFRPVIPMPVAERVEVQRVVQEMTCPEGLVLQGNVCAGVEIMPPSIACPPGSSLSHGRCVKFARLNFDCPPGFQMGPGHRCVRTQMIPAEFTCREGETLDGSGTSCLSSVPSPPQCPPGYLLSGHQCIQKVPSSFDCPPEHTMSPINGQCVKHSVVPAVMICPEGSRLDSTRNKCMAFQQIPPQCPPSYTFDPLIEACSRLVPPEPSPCPEGFENSGDVCERTVTEKADVSCPENFVMDGTGGCLQRILPPMQCPPEYQQSRLTDGMCEKLVKEVPVCPEGSATIGPGRCQSKSIHDSVECCGPGFSIEAGVCVRKEVHAVQQSCKEECFKVRSIPKAFACPADAEFVDDPIAPKCVQRTTSKKCSAAPRGQCDRGQCEKMAPSELRSNSPPELPLSASKDICNDVRQEKIMLAEPYCPNGSEMQGNRCVIKEPIIPDPVCSVGDYDSQNDRCVKIVTAPVRRECPPGTVREGRSCISLDVVEPMFVCPSDAEQRPDGTCVSAVPAIKPDAVVTRTSALMSCPRGFHLNDGNCTARLTIPLGITCPAGSINSPKGCLVTAELQMRPPVEKVVRASHICPDGSSPRGCDCLTMSTVAALPVCPRGFTSADSSGDLCVKAVKPVVSAPRVITSVALPVCPAGTHGKGATCVSTEHAEPLPFCPEGFDVAQDQCVTSHPPASICPQGTIPAPDGCMREVQMQPQVRVVQGCVHQSPCDECAMTQVCHRL